MTALMVKQVVEVAASPEKVWRVLTEPQFTRQYMYGCSPVTSWEVGSPLNWELIHEGKPMIPAAGIVLEVKAPNLLRYTVVDPNAAHAKNLKDHLEVTCTVTPTSTGSRLEFLQGDFSTVADGANRYADSTAGGDTLLLQIKAIAEAA